MCEMFESVKNAIINGLPSLQGHKPYACDVHDYLFNEEIAFVYTADAERVAEELSVWECIGVVQAYEKANFGEVYTPLSDACRVANAVHYILGGQALYAIFGETVYFTDKRNNDLSDEDLDAMQQIATAWFTENPDGINKIWLDLPTE